MLRVASPLMQLPKTPQHSIDGSATDTALPLSVLLSQVLIAFTIEFDNEFEHQMPHRTTTVPATASASPTTVRNGPWLVSMVMFSNFMQFVSEQGVTVGELQRQARTAKLSLDGMERWGYVLVERAAATTGSKLSPRDWILRPTAKGRRAQEVWRALFGVIEKRWRERFGNDAIDSLRESLSALVSQLDVELPEYLPVLGYGMIAEIPHHKRHVAAFHNRNTAPRLHLPTLLSQVLLAFTIDFERESELSLAMSANVLRILNEKGVRIRDLPRLSGVSKEAIKMSVGFLEKCGYVVIEPEPTAGRTKLIRLSPKGREARAAYCQRLGAIEEQWQTRFGKNAIHNLRDSLERLVGKPTAQPSPLFCGLEPHADGWRASVPKPETLPYYPMVLHRGGYPDGS